MRGSSDREKEEMGTRGGGSASGPLAASAGLGRGGGGDAGSSPSRAGLEISWEPAGAV